jgi:thiamine pyrophosphate-dependent acetolactate synthase large subunit-like protein
VVAIGASLNYYSVDGGHMVPAAEVVQIDPEPLGLRNGLQAADLYLRADAKLAAAAALARLRERGGASARIRSGELARRIREEPADGAQFPIEPGLLDPRRVIDELDRVLPKDYDSVSGAGHQSYFHSTMRGRRPENYHAIREFGAIGNGISLAIGVAAARKNGKAVLFEGDGSLLMHIQELEMVARHRLKLLICVLNDGAYGSELHKLRADGLDDSGSIFGRTDLAAIARGFGLRGATVTDVSQLGSLFEAYQAQDTAELWNIHVSDRVVSPSTRRGVGRGHGKM